MNVFKYCAIHVTRNCQSPIMPDPGSVSYLWHCKVNANYTVSQKTSTFLFFELLCENEPISIIFSVQICDET